MDEVFLAISKKQCRPKVNGFKIKITEQKYRGCDFYAGKTQFNSSNGLKITSCSCPEIQECYNQFFVRGDDGSRDGLELNVTPEFLSRIEFAIDEYNTRMNQEKLKPARRERQKVLSFIATFYSLIELETRGYNTFQFKAYTKNFEKAFAKMLFDYTVFTCMGEARHARNHTRGRRAFPELEMNGSAGGETHRNLVYANASEYDPMDTLEKMYDTFNSVKWYDSSYGGKKWGKLAEIGRTYGTVSNRVFIDSIVHLQHNSGSIFNKPLIFKNELRDECGYDSDGKSIRRIDAYLERRGTANGDPILSAYKLNINVSVECLGFIKDAVEKKIIKADFFPNHSTLFLDHNVEYGFKKLNMIMGTINEEDKPSSSVDITENDADEEFKPIKGCDCPDCVKYWKEKAEEEEINKLNIAKVSYEQQVSAAGAMKSIWVPYSPPASGSISGGYEFTIQSKPLSSPKEQYNGYSGFLEGLGQGTKDSVS